MIFQNIGCQIHIDHKIKAKPLYKNGTLELLSFDQFYEHGPELANPPIDSCVMNNRKIRL